MGLKREKGGVWQEMGISDNQNGGEKRDWGVWTQAPVLWQRLYDEGKPVLPGPLASFAQ